MDDRLTRLEPGMAIPYGGNRVTRVSADLADAFSEGDSLIVVQDTGALLHVPQEAAGEADKAVTSADEAFSRMGLVADDAITRFYKLFAERLGDETVFAEIAAANVSDIETAQAKGRSTTRLVLSERMRSEMIAGLEMWAGADAGRGHVEDRVDHSGWRLDMVRSGLGVVAFIFEGRPNVLADATGVLRGGNTVVFRIGSDALGTARAIMRFALAPSLVDAGLPEGAVSLVNSASRAAGLAMFSDRRVGLAVARGSGGAVAQLGSVARQTGIPVSLHGTGGAWIVAASSADPHELEAAVYNSLDRKVCNTVNTVCLVSEVAEQLAPSVLKGLERAAERLGTTAKLHVTERARHLVPDSWWDEASISRAEGDVTEAQTETISEWLLGEEWEWEQSPEITLTVVEHVDEAVSLFNELSPRFAASLISSDSGEHESFFAAVDAPFVGNGFTRWVDGQYALNRPELGLSNWQFGRLFGRSGILSGDSVFTVRGRVTQDDPDIGR